MKPTPLNKKLLAAMLAACGATLIPSLRATSATWDGSTDSTWATVANWDVSGIDPAAVPGTGDTATFSGAGNSNTTIDLGSGVTIGTLVFDTTSASAYTIGSGGVGNQAITLNDTGAVTLGLSAATATTTNQLINANVTLGTAITGTTTITNNATSASGVSLTFAGNITGGTGGTAGTKTLNIAGTGAVNLQGTINKGGATVINVANVGTGNTTLSGSGTSALGTLRATAGGTVTVNNASANITVASSSQYGGSTAFGKFILTNGSVAFNGGIQSGTSSGALAGADGMAFIVNGGTFSASSVALGRSSNTGSSTTFYTTAFNMGTSGFQVNGGTATVTGSVRIAGSNSSATGQVTGTGSLTIGGELALGETTTRSNLFQVTGGTLTVNDTTGGGVVIGKGTASATAAGQLLLTGGTTTTEKVTFGLNGGLAGSSGNLTMNGATANLYIGSGGIVLAATNSYTQAINLMNGTLGAKADWSSSLNMTLAGSGMTIKAADAANVAHNITLSGVLSGSNGFTKTGAGTLTLSGANTYTGGTLVNAGTLAYGNSFTMAGANQVTLAATGTAGTNYATVTSSAGTLTFGGTLAINFSSSILSGGESFNLFQASGGSLATGFSGVSVAGAYTTTLTNNAGVWTGSANGFDFTFTESTGTLGVLASAVPEPATYATLAGLGILGFAAYRRRRTAA